MAKSNNTPRKERQFTGHFQTQTVLNTFLVTQAIPLLTPVIDLESPRRITHKVTWLDIWIRRLTNGVQNALAGVVFRGNTDIGTFALARPVSPLSTSDFQDANTDIMKTFGLSVPPLLNDSIDVLIDNGEVVHTRVVIESMKKVDRANAGIWLMLQSAVIGSVVTATVKSRTLYLY